MEIDYKKSLLTGGSGLLGKNLIPLFNKDSILHPTSKVMDITDPTSVSNYFKDNLNIDCVIHAAAYTDVKKAEMEFIRCNFVNVVGTFNILKECYKRNIKLIYISTDAVFDGSKGNYKVNEPVCPVSKYAKSKTAGELLVRTYNNSLVIRTSFFGNNFPYSKAFIDQWSSKDYIDIIAPKIYSLIKSNKKGIAHVYSKRRSLYELATLRNKDVIPCSIKEFQSSYELPIDLSLKGDNKE